MLIVKDIMSTNLLILHPDATLREAIEFLAKHHISGAPVMQDDQLVGIISELEMFDVLFDLSLRSALVSEFMTEDVQLVDEMETLGDLAHRFALYRVRRFPVMRDNTLVGIVSRRDLLRFSLDIDTAVQEPLSEFMPFFDEELA